MEKVYLIGGSGFIGKNLAKRLSQEYEVTVFDKFIDEEFFGNHPEIRTVCLDLIEEKIPAKYCTPDFIINLASIVTAERDLSLFDGLIATNLKILLNIFERFRGEHSLKMFMQFGSSEEYGSDGSPFKETMREQPNSPYALVKQLTTNTALMLHKNYGFPAMVVRPGNLFGPGQNPTKFIPYIIDRLKRNLPLDVTPCEQKRDFIHVEDFSNDIAVLLSSYKVCIGKIINVSSGESIALKEIIEDFKVSLNSTSRINYGALPYRENEAMDLRCDTARLDSLRKKYNIHKNIKNIK